MDQFADAVAEPPDLGIAPLVLAPSATAALRLPAKVTWFPYSDHTRAFRARFFPEATSTDWNDWRWQMRSRIRSLAQVDKVYRLSDDARRALSQHKTGLPIGLATLLSGGACWLMGQKSGAA